ncbi:MAG: hypothetical protein U0894_12525 [Pirellulales bacterium]
MTVVLYAAMEFVLLNLIGPQAQTAICGRCSALDLVVSDWGLHGDRLVLAKLKSSRRGLQYAGLVMFAALEAIITFPILLYANRAQPGVLPSAGPVDDGGVWRADRVAFVSKRVFPS